MLSGVEIFKFFVSDPLNNKKAVPLFTWRDLIALETDENRIQ